MTDHDGHFCVRQSIEYFSSENIIKNDELIYYVKKIISKQINKNMDNLEYDN